MPSWSQISDELGSQFPELDQDVVDWIAQKIVKDKEVFAKTKADGKLTFGKYAGYSLDELAKTDKGKSYLQWLLSQSFFSREKYPEYHAKLEELGLKKKTKPVPAAAQLE